MTYAVLTGDIIKSSSLGENSGIVLQNVKTVLSELQGLARDPDEVVAVSGIFRGDSFQAVFSVPRRAIKAALYIRSRLLAMSERNSRVDVRMAIGFGGVDRLNIDYVEESDGEAFRLSGRGLDSMKRYQRFIFISKGKNESALKAIGSLLDVLTNHWTSRQAEVMSFWLTDKTQASIAEEMDLSQPTIHKHLALAGAYAIEDTIEAIERILNSSENER
jgi:predicted DNA-binding protein YlxM (UPF0122 family)